MLFVGDHVMGWSTSIVAPPDGSMIDYMASLERLTARNEDLYFSGHGPEIPDGPRYVRFLIRHRQAREASILHRLAKGEADIPTMVRAIYIGIDPRLTGAAGYSVLAHLEDLVARGIVATDGDPVIGGTYRLAGGGEACTRFSIDLRFPGRCAPSPLRATSLICKSGLRGSRTTHSGDTARPDQTLLLHHLGRSLDRRLRLLHYRLGVVDGVVDVVDQAGDARGVAAEIAFEIAG